MPLREYQSRISFLRIPEQLRGASRLMGFNAGHTQAIVATGVFSEERYVHERATQNGFRLQVPLSEFLQTMKQAKKQNASAHTQVASIVDQQARQAMVSGELSALETYEGSLRTLQQEQDFTARRRRAYERSVRYASAIAKDARTDAWDLVIMLFSLPELGYSEGEMQHVLGVNAISSILQGAFTRLSQIDQIAKALGFDVSQYQTC